jgi:cell division protein FtsX
LETGETEMSKFIATIVVLAAIVVGVGFYLNWFSVTKTEDKVNNETDINVRIHKTKVASDTAKAKEKAQEVEHKIEKEFQKK